jgi:RluA family pseudouridine synthase
MSSFVNIAAYHFVPLDNLPELRQELKDLTAEHQLKGTILLTPEGINLFIAGHREGIDALLTRLRQLPGLEQFEVKESLSDDQPFERMLVKIKREIIAFGIDGIEPRAYTSRKLPAQELRQWLSEKKEVLLYDVRNDYEVKVGTFSGALSAGIDHFRDFPEAVERLPDEYKDRPVVMFCTGGIRCEKAGPFMERAGFKDVWQLEGGILKYFEECGGDFYDGDCFVFDKRVALNPRLQESNTTQCYACLAPVTPEEQQSPHYDPPRSCPHCYRTPLQKMHELCEQREAQIAAVVDPLPGSIPYDNVRPMSIPLRLDKVTLIEALAALYSHVPREEWLALFEQGLIVHKGQPVQPERIVRAGERFGRLFPGLIEPAVSTDIGVLYEDDSLIILNKPAPLPMHACGRFNRNTLEWILHQVYSPAKPRPAHRLDANTTGVVVFTKSRLVASRVQPQFEQGQVQKTYLARVSRTQMADGRELQPGMTFSCEAPLSRESQIHGSRVVDAEGLPAQTEFTVLKVRADGTALLEVRPLTGRTNQIRVHLWHLGLPICNDPLYQPGTELGDEQTVSLTAAPLNLHAWKVTFRHPQTKEPVSFTAPPPAWAEM